MTELLSAFAAELVIELKARDKSKIESILAYGDRIFVGLSTGCVRVYRLNDDSGRPDRSGGTTDPADDKLQLTDLLRENEKFSRRPVVQLAIVKEANILVSLSENIVSLHHTQDLTLVEKLDNSKGATLFAIISDVLKDVVTGIPTIVSKLAVAIKRRLVIWTWMDMELAPDTPELQLIATIKSLTWVNDTSIVVGTDVGFLAVDVASKAINDIIKPSSAGVGNVSAGVRFGSAASATVGYVTIGSWIPKPLSCRLSKEELLLVKDVNSLFIDKDGKALDKRQIPWATAPEAVGSSYQYMLSLNSPARGSLEVRNPDTLSHLQTISLPNAHILQLPQPSISLAHAGKNFLVGSDRRVWKMRGLAYDAQVQDLVLKHEYDEAISLLHLLEDTLIDDKSSRVREITVTKAKAMFSQAKYRKAFDLFAEASAAPAIVISLFPKLISGDMKRLDGTDLPPGEETNSPSRLAQASSRALTRQSEVVEKNDHTSPTRSLLGRIRGRQQNETDADVAVQSPNNETEDSEDDISTASGQLRGENFRMALNELCSYLAHTRVQIQKYMKPIKNSAEIQHTGGNPEFAHLLVAELGLNVDWYKELRDLATLVDTTLFRAYLIARPSLAGSLFRIDNFCDPVIVEEKLLESKRYADIIDFYFGKKMHQRALDLLKRLGSDDFEDVQIHFSAVERTVAYLQQLSPQFIDLILTYAVWPLKLKPQLGMQIFLSDTENAETLPQDTVIHFLQDFDIILAIEYLEHIIQQLNDQNPKHHQLLVDNYCERMQRTWHDVGIPPGVREERRRQILSRLLQFLKDSNHYDRARSLRALSATEPTFLDCRAVVLDKMGQHKQVLDIYVFQMRDLRKAEQYCDEVYGTWKQDSLSRRESAVPIYQILLSLYVKPSAPHEPDWESAISLLSKYGARIAASTTIDLLPEAVTIADVKSYFEGYVRSVGAGHKLERMTGALLGVEKVLWDEALVRKSPGSQRTDAGEHLEGHGTKTRRILLDEDRRCMVCHKKFGGSAIKVFPDNTVIHYGCVK